MSDQLFPTDPDPFDLDDGVPFDLIAHVDERAPGSYLRIHDGMLDDDAVGDLIAECGAAGLGIWLAVLVAAKEARAFGILSLNTMTFGGALGATSADVLDAVHAMVRARLVWAQVDGRRVRLRVRRWHRWQSMTDAEAKRLDRRREKHGVENPRRRRRNETAVGDDNPSASIHGNEDGIGETNTDIGVGLPLRARVHEASSDHAPSWAALRAAVDRLYPEPANAQAAYDALRHEAGMNMARVSVAGITWALREVRDRIEREPGWAPAALIPYVMQTARRFRPDAAPVPNPTPKERPDDRPATFDHDPTLKAFD